MLIICDVANALSFFSCRPNRIQSPFRRNRVGEQILQELLQNGAKRAVEGRRCAVRPSQHLGMLRLRIKQVRSIQERGFGRRSRVEESRAWEICREWEFRPRQITHLEDPKPRASLATGKVQRFAFAKKGGGGTPTKSRSFGRPQNRLPGATVSTRRSFR